MVSARRRTTRISTAMPVRPVKAKMARQDSHSVRCPPIAGATMGATTMATVR